MTSLEEFLQSPAAVTSLPVAGDTPQTGAALEVPGPSPEGTLADAGAVAPDSPAPVGEPEFVTALTPSGIEVLYQWAPKRLYKVRNVPRANDGEDEAIDPDYGWVEVQSVTTVLGCLDKPGLPWWGMKTGVEGALELASRGLLRWANDQLVVPGRGLTGSTLVPATVENIVELLTEFKLTTNHTLDKASSRGQSVHDAFESWANNDIWPQPDIYPETERGYVQGLVRFLEDVAIEPGGTEVMVGSLVHKYAGRYDLRAILADSDLVTRTYPKKADKIEGVPGGSYLLDLKTSKGVYPTHFMQLEAYEEASIECGYSPTDARAVVHVTADGRYEFVRSRATFADFLAVKGANDALESLKRRRK